MCVFSFSFTWPHTNVFDRVNVNRVGFGKEKTIHMSPFPPHYFLLATHMTFTPTIFIYLFIYFPYSLLYSPLGFKKLFLPMYFFYPSTTTHFFFYFLYPFSFISFALVDFGGWFLLGFFCFVCLGHFYKG